MMMMLLKVNSQQYQHSSEVAKRLDALHFLNAPLKVSTENQSCLSRTMRRDELTVRQISSTVRRQVRLAVDQ